MNFAIISSMIGIMSDSHDNLAAVGRAIARLRNAGCRMLVHAGDFVAPFAARELEKAGCPVKAVFGNCDGEKRGLAEVIRRFGEVREAPFVFNYNKINILITHLDAPVTGYAAGRRHDVIVFGHTHRPEVRRAEKTLVINPGETGGWLTGKSTVALFDPETGKAEIIEV